MGAIDAPRQGRDDRVRSSTLVPKCRVLRYFSAGTTLGRGRCNPKLAGFYLLPTFDMPTTTCVTVGINAGVGLLALAITSVDAATPLRRLSRAPPLCTRDEFFEEIKELIYIAIALSGVVPHCSPQLSTTSILTRLVEECTIGTRFRRSWRCSSNGARLRQHRRTGRELERVRVARLRRLAFGLNASCHLCATARIVLRFKLTPASTSPILVPATRRMLNQSIVPFPAWRTPRALERVPRPSSSNHLLSCSQFSDHRSARCVMRTQSTLDSSTDGVNAGNTARRSVVPHRKITACLRSLVMHEAGQRRSRRRRASDWPAISRRRARSPCASRSRHHGPGPRCACACARWRYTNATAYA